MISFPNCKINLGLRILSKRKDGYHDLESVFYPVNWCDALEIFPAKEFSFEVKGNEIPGGIENNLCVKAYQLLRHEFDLPPVKMILLKNIPTGAGLGGGSADVSFTLKMLNELYDLKLSLDQLKNHALQLGSDCTFFLENKPCLVTGRGEQLQSIDVDLSGYQIVIVYPDTRIDTSWAYQALSEERGGQVAKGIRQVEKRNISDIIRLPAVKWKDHLKNDFEEVVFQKYPAVAEIKERLYEAGADYASLSGSGSAVYGLFRQTPVLSMPSSYQIYSKADL